MATKKQEAARIRTALNEGERFFSWNEKVGETYDVDISYISSDLKLLKFAQGEMGTISDCYLLYAVAVMGVADLESIRLYLYALHNLHKDLSISDMSEESTDVVRERLVKLYRAGFLCRHAYTTLIPDNKGGLKESDVVLYTIPKNAQSFINQKLVKSTSIQEWIHAKPVFVLEGWAACSYLAARIAQNPGFVKMSQGIFKTSRIGVNNIANVVKMKNPAEDGQFIYVGFMYSYLHYVTSFQTEEDYKDNCLWLMKRFKQFLFSQDSKKHVVRLVVLAEDNYDLMELSRLIIASEFLAGDYDRIYFTGEGVLRLLKKSDVDFKGCFLRIKKTRTKEGFDLIPDDPDFLS